MFFFKSYTKVPKQGGRVYGGGGLVEVEGSVVWGGREGGVYMFNETNSIWNETAEGDEYGARLAVFGGRLARVGGYKNSVYSKGVMKLRGGRWSLMPDMLIGCTGSCVLCVSGGVMVVMGGGVDEGRQLDDVQVFDGETQTWHRGPSLPQPCWAMSAVVHGDLVFVMGGHGMDRAVWCADIHDLTTTPTHDTQQSIWRRLPDVPHEYSSVCVVQGVLLALGGLDGLKKTSAIHAFHHYDQNWELVAHLPFACYSVDTLSLSGGGLLVVDGDSQQVLKITVEGLPKLFPITPTIPNRADERQLMWSGESGVTKQDPSTSVPVSLDSEPSLPLLMDKVAAVIPHKYMIVGLQLRLSLAELQVIRPQHQGLEEHHRAFGEIFDVWRRRGSPPYTWRTLIDVLRSASVGEVSLSDELTSWITQHH